MTNGTNNFEQPDPEQAENQIARETFLQKIGRYFETRKNDPRLNELKQERKDMFARDLILGALVVAEVVPGVEMANEATKAQAIFQKIRENKGEIKDTVKSSIPDLYPGIHPAILALFGAVDFAQVPLVGAIPELYVLMADTLKRPFSRLKSNVRNLQIAKDVFLKRSTNPKVVEAKQAFTN